jgi:hypothetical protein
MEGSDRLIDWGVKEAAQNKNAACLNLVAESNESLPAEVVVVENPMGRKSRRCERVRELIRLRLPLAISVFSSLSPNVFYPLEKTDSIKICDENNDTRNGSDNNGVLILPTTETRSLHCEEVRAWHAAKC